MQVQSADSKTNGVTTMAQTTDTDSLAWDCHNSQAEEEEEDEEDEEDEAMVF